MNKVIIDRESYIFDKNIKENPKYRESFFELSNKVFDIDFEKWYRLGYWTERYIPYSLISNDKLVSNVSVNKIELDYLNSKYLFIQLGTVMTDVNYRNRGLADYLIKKVLAEWKDKADNIYLYANESVLDFYPKYGFEEESEYSFVKRVTKEDGKVSKLDMNSERDLKLFLELYTKGNPYSKINMVNNFELLMFYCSSFLEDKVYYIAEYGVVAVLEFMDRTMVCYDIYGDEKVSLDKVLSRLSAVDTSAVELGFAPKKTEGYKKIRLRINIHNYFL